MSQRQVRTFTFQSLKVTFQISELLILPEAKKAIFYDMRNLGEIGFDHNFQDDDQEPTIKLHKIRGNVGKLMQV